MFYVSSNLGNNMLGITDTSDNVTEVVSLEHAMSLIRSGIEIRGITKSGIVFCKSDDLIKDYVIKVRPTLAKLKMLNSLDYNTAVDTLKTLASNIGLCLDKNDLIINYESNALIIKSKKISIVYDNNGNYRVQDLKNGVDISDTDIVSDVTRVGDESLDFITIVVSGKKYKLSSAISVALMCLTAKVGKNDGSIDYGSLQYIGYTPSNYIFKIIFYGTTYSIEFTSDLNDFKKSIKPMLARAKKVSKGEYSLISSYIGNADDISVDGLYIKKCNNKGGVSYNKLHEKYKTLKDVYVKR